MLTTFMRILSGVLSVYMILIFIRILLTWFHGPYFGRPMEILIQITEPYLQYFRRFEFLRTERIDFSPIAAILVLVVLQNIANTIAVLGTITLGIILSLLVSAVWSAISFLLTFFIILIAIRLIGQLFGVNSMSPFWHTLDTILQPVLSGITRKLRIKKPLTYPSALAVFGGGFLVISLVGRVIIRQIAMLLRALPL